MQHPIVYPTPSLGDDLNEPDLSWEGPQMVRFMSWYELDHFFISFAVFHTGMLEFRLRNPSEPINNRHALRNHIRRKVEGLLQFTWARLRTQTEDSEDLQVALRKRFGDIWNILDRHSRVLEKQEESFNTCFAALEERLQKLEGVTARLEESTT